MTKLIVLVIAALVMTSCGKDFKSHNWGDSRDQFVQRAGSPDDVKEDDDRTVLYYDRQFARLPARMSAYFRPGVGFVGVRYGVSGEGSLDHDVHVKTVRAQLDRDYPGGCTEVEEQEGVVICDYGKVGSNTEVSMGWQRPSSGVANVVRGGIELFFTPHEPAMRTEFVQAARPRK